MANEISVTINSSISNTGFIDSIAPGTIKVNQNTLGAFSEIVTAGTSAASVSLAGIATPGIMHLQNLDPTNYVQWGYWNGSALQIIGRLNAGDPPASFRMDAGATLGLQAHTASCKVLVKCWND